MTKNTMKILSKTSKSVILSTTIILGFFVSVTSPFDQIAYSVVNNPSIPIDDSCMENAKVLAHQKASLMDTNKAKELTNTNDEFQSRTQGYITSFGSIFNDWQIDPTTCVPTLQGVNVVYFLNDTNGYARNLVFTLDPQINKITKVDEYVSDFKYISSVNWDGYEFKGNSAGTNQVYEAKAQYNQPAGSKPVSGPTCYPKPCDISIWTGLEDTPGATNKHLAQTGTSSRVVCNVSGTCATSYFMWYEFLPNAAVYCSGTVNSGNTITADVVNQKKGNPSGDPTKYNITTTATGGAMCTVTGYVYTAMNNPTIAPFINERACYSGCSGTPTYFSIAKFSPADTMTGWIYYNNVLNSISVPWGAGYFTEYQMWNSGTKNISHTPYTSPGSSFTETYSSSLGT